MTYTEQQEMLADAGAETTLNHADREHVELSPSSSYRWMACPASIRLSRGIPNRSSAASLEGTAAHELAQLCLTNRQDAEEYVGRVVSEHEVTAEMAEGVQVYVDEVRRVHHDALPSARWIEHRVNLAALNPPGPMAGTADALCYVTGHSTVYVHDLKFGARTRVAADSPQLRIYALGAMLAVAADPVFGRMPVRRVVATIVQPRQPAAGRDPIRSIEYDAEDLLFWAELLMEHARAALAPDSPAKAGAWCQFCPAAGRCPEQAKDALRVAQLEFGDLVAQQATPPPADAAVLSPEELGRIASALPALEQFIRSVRAAVVGEISEGREVPGWKLVETEGHAKWQAPEDAAVNLLMHGIDPWQPQEIISPAKARERITATSYGFAIEDWEAAGKPKGKKPTKKDHEALARDALAPATYRPRNTALVPAADPRPAIAGGAAEFSLLPDEAAT